MAQATFKPRLRNHKVLAQTACELDPNDVELGNRGGSKGVSLEIPTGG